MLFDIILDSLNIDEQTPPENVVKRLAKLDKLFGRICAFDQTSLTRYKLELYKRYLEWN